MKFNCLAYAEAHVRVIYELVEGECGVVRLDHGVGHLGGGNHGVGAAHPVRVLLRQLDSAVKQRTSKH